MLWAIENLDNAGEGLFVCDAPNRKTALRMHMKKNGSMEVTACYHVKWIDMALVSGPLGESYYWRRKWEARNGGRRHASKD